MSYKYLYRFKNKDFEIGEIHNLALGSDTPKDQRYQWLLKLDKEVLRLSFVSSARDEFFHYRVFDKASIKFNETECLLDYQNVKYKLDAVSIEEEVDSRWIL